LSFLSVTGKVFQINLKGKTPGARGLPKTSVESTQVSKRGLEGDFNVYRHEKLADDPDSAVLIMPLETINQLNREGWPIKPGDIGENFTTTGLAYNGFSIGKEVAIGNVKLQISRACDPCTNLYSLPYVGPQKGPLFLKVMMGRRGWYARVTKEGRVSKGDNISVL
jgi:MOSC domain-containing protein YiiM